MHFFKITLTKTNMKKHKALTSEMICVLTSPCKGNPTRWAGEFLKHS